MLCSMLYDVLNACTCLHVYIMDEWNEHKQYITHTQKRIRFRGEAGPNYIEKVKMDRQGEYIYWESSILQNIENKEKKTIKYKASIGSAVFEKSSTRSQN